MISGKISILSLKLLVIMLLFGFRSDRTRTFTVTNCLEEEIKMLQKKCLEDLVSILNNEGEWIKVHAAEFLIWEGNGTCDTDIEELFLKENDLFGDTSYYRIGIWRVLAQASTTDSGKNFWRNKILEVFVNPNEVDRIHAIESLAKLRYTPLQCFTLEFPNINESDLSPFDLYTQWSRAHISQNEASKTCDLMIDVLAKSDSKNNAVKRIASYILRYIGKLTDNQWKSLKYLILTSDNLELRPSLLSTLWITKPKSLEMGDLLRSELMSLRSRKANVIHFLAAIGEVGCKRDVDLVKKVYEQLSDVRSQDYNPDLHASAAYTLLKLINKTFNVDY